jgi:hypothetical protein
VNHIHFWIKDGLNIVKRRGVFGQTGKVQALTCLTPCGANMLSGSVDGHIYVWYFAGVRGADATGWS